MAMIDPFTGQISMVGFNWAPVDWAKCDGQVVAITQNAALYALLGTEFGGNGQSTFAYPDLRSRTPVGWNPGIQDIGVHGGLENVTLLEANMPVHTHLLEASDANGDFVAPIDTGFAIAVDSADTGKNIYGTASNLVGMSPNALPTSAGGSQSHNNMQPVQVVNFVLCLSGLFPPRN